MDLARLHRNEFLVLGRAGMDFYADPPGTLIEEARAFFPALGGSAANIATAITQLGGKAALVTTVSKDAVGRYIQGELIRYGVSKAYVREDDGGVRTSLAVVETRSENCQSVLYRNGAADFELSVDQVADLPYEHAGALIITGTSLAMEPSRAATFAAISHAHHANLPVIMDIDYRAYSWRDQAEAADICRHAVAKCDIIIGNDEEFSVLAKGGDGLELGRALARESAAVVIYKKGEKGSITITKDGEFSLGVYRVTALKPTGAGDAFMGGFVTGLATGLSLKDSVKRGSASAAIVVTRVGCSSANPDLSDLQTFMAKHSLD